MDLLRLRRETASDHQRAESSVPLVHPGLTQDAYVTTLGRLFGFVHGWELWAQTAAPQDLQPQLAERRRSHLLASDLNHFGASVPTSFADAFPPADQLPRAAFLGSVYVLEGSTLGGQHIARHVEQTLHLPHGQGNAYFVGYGPRTGGMWRGFQSLLSALPELDTDTVIRSARLNFLYFERWMQTSPQRSRLRSDPRNPQETHA